MQLHSLSGLHLSCILNNPFAEIKIVGVARSVAAQHPHRVDPVPNESLLGDPGEFVNFLPVKGISRACKMFRPRPLCDHAL